jgi:MFS family permease
MSTMEVRALCLCNVAIYAGIAGFVGVMPVYLTQLGAGSTLTGFFLAFAYLCLALSTVIAGRLSDRLQRRKGVLLLSSACAAPITWLMGATTTVVPLMVVTGCLWFVTGTAMTMVTILAGVCANAAERGWLFGRLTLSARLGLLLGNLISGPIVDRWGYHALFIVLGLVYLGLPSASMVVPDKRVALAPREGAPRSAILTQRPFLFLFVASIVGQAANIVMVLSRALLMYGLHFEAAAITTVAALGSVVTLPLPLLSGRLADRLGPKPILFVCFASTPLGLLFWGIVLGLSAGGLAISAVQMTPTLLLSVLLSLAALLALLPISAAPPADQHEAATGQRGAAARRDAVV